MSRIDQVAVWQRRRFLQACAAAPLCGLATASMSESLFGILSRSNIEVVDGLNLGFSLYGTKHLPLDQSLQACAAAGYRHVEFCLNAGFPTEPAVFDATARRQTAQRLQELNLTLPCLMIQIPLVCDETVQQASLQVIRTAAQLARDLVPEQPPMLETVVGGNPAKWDEQKAGMLKHLQGWATVAQEHQVTLLIKAHVGSAMNSPERLLWLLQECGSPAVEAAYDFSHFELQGLDLRTTLTQLLPRTRFIHVKDTAGDAAKFRFLLPGEGRTDYVQYFRLLRELKYAGPVCVEVSGQVSGQPGYDPFVAIRSTAEKLTSALATSAGQTSTEN